MRMKRCFLIACICLLSFALISCDNHKSENENQLDQHASKITSSEEATWQIIRNKYEGYCYDFIRKEEGAIIECLNGEEFRNISDEKEKRRYDRAVSLSKFIRMVCVGIIKKDWTLEQFFNHKNKLPDRPEFSNLFNYGQEVLYLCELPYGHKFEAMSQVLMNFSAALLGMEFGLFY